MTLQQQTMEAAVLSRPRSPLEIETLRMPKPRMGEVLVRVAACGVCHTDLHVKKDEVAFPTPCVLGHEISGTVAELGPGVSHVAVGSRVICSFIMPCGVCWACARGHEDLCATFFELNRLRGMLFDGETRLFRPDGTPIAMYSMGGLAEYSVVPATDVFPLPENLSLSDSAIFGCALLTAYGAVSNVGDLRAGETVAVIGAGGVGSNIIQVARAFGARQIIAVDVVEAKLDAAKALGATDVVNGRLVDPLEQIRALTAGRGVDVAFESLGRPETFKTTVEAATDGGRAVIVGIAPRGVVGEVEITRLVRRKVQILGSYGGRPRTDIPALLNLAAAGLIDAGRLITRRYALHDVDEAYQALERGEIVGRALIDFSM